MVIKKWIFAFSLALAFVCASSFLQAYSLPKSIEAGKAVYETYCMNCHMVDGKGTPDVFPPLAKADYLKKPVKNLIGLVLQGQTGKVVVNGKTYNGVMPAQDYLTDEQIADALNYSRNSWGNKIAGTITPSQVKALRK